MTGTYDVHPEFSSETIWPYTDLLLHDMGESLADHISDGLASGTEWKTPPLWCYLLYPDSLFWNEEGYRFS